MNSPLPKWIMFGVAIGVLASFGAVGTLPLDTQSLNWLTTFSATLVSAALAAAVGIWLFRFQREVSDKNERDRLQMMLAIEAQLNLDVLGERPAEFLHSGTGECVARAVLVQLPLGALEELTRSGLETPEVTSGLMRVAAHMRVHNNDVATLLSVRTGSISKKGITALAEDVNRRQKILKDTFEEMLEGLKRALKEEGMEPPPSVDRDGALQVDPFVSAKEARDWIRGQRNGTSKKGSS